MAETYSNEPGPESARNAHWASLSLGEGSTLPPAVRGVHGRHRFSGSATKPCSYRQGGGLGGAGVGWTVLPHLPLVTAAGNLSQNPSWLSGQPLGGCL